MRIFAARCMVKCSSDAVGGRAVEFKSKVRERLIVANDAHGDDAFGFARQNFGKANADGLKTKMDADGYITLLPPGQEIASRIYDRHQLLTQFLLQLGVSPENASADACKIEHDISDESYEKIKALTLRQQAASQVSL